MLLYMIKQFIIWPYDLYIIIYYFKYRFECDIPQVSSHCKSTMIYEDDERFAVLEALYIEVILHSFEIEI